VGNPEGKRPLERPRSRWEDAIRLDLRDIGWCGVECIHLAQDRDRWRAVVNAVMNLRVLAPQSYLPGQRKHSLHDTVCMVNDGKLQNVREFIVQRANKYIETKGVLFVYVLEIQGK
jgi:hypothetical protein